MYFQKPGRKSEITWKKFRKPGENFQKSFGHPGKGCLCEDKLSDYEEVSFQSITEVRLTGNRA